MLESDYQLLNPGKRVDLFELDATKFDGDILRWHSGVNELGTHVVWQGNTYTHYAVEASGFERSSKGSLPRPMLKVGNITGLLGAYVRSLHDLVGCTLIRRRTFVKYLDAVNFAAGNPQADPNAGFPDEVWSVDRKVAENPVFLEFELTAAMDVQGYMLPGRQVIQNVCTSIYRSAECGYSGGAVADRNDVPTGDAALDNCGKRLVSCKLRFGENGVLNFGGFPGAGLLR